MSVALLRVKDLQSAASGLYEVERAAEGASRVVGLGRNFMEFTSRQLVPDGTAEESLAIGKQVSESLVLVVLAVSTIPGYIPGS